MLSVWPYDPKRVQRGDHEEASRQAQALGLDATETNRFVDGFLAGIQYARQQIANANERSRRMNTQY